MFVQVTPINQVTGVATGNPIYVSGIQTIERISATAEHVDYTLIRTGAVSIICLETPEQILPVVVGSSVRGGISVD